MTDYVLYCLIIKRGKKEDDIACRDVGDTPLNTMLLLSMFSSNLDEYCSYLTLRSGCFTRI